MTYCLLRQDARADHWAAISLEGADPDALSAGRLVEAVETPIRITLSSWGSTPSDFLEYPWFVVSTAMRRVLDAAGVDNIQFLEAVLRVDDSELTHVGDYWVGNVVGLVSCINRDKSPIEPDAPVSGSLRAFHVDFAESHRFLLFRLAEDNRLIVISERLRTALQAADLHGLLFQDTVTYEGRQLSTESDTPDTEEP